MLSVVICTYNRDKYIYDCLAHLARNTMKEGWEIILVNNNSTDNTAAECERFVQDFAPNNYHYFVETSQGLSFARNRGIEEAKGDWIIFLDDDAMVQENYLATLLPFLEQYKEAGAFGGAISPFFEAEEPKWINPWSLSFVSALDKGDKVTLFEKNKYPIGANMGISRKAIEKVGKFNTQLGRTANSLLGGEEKDIFLRIQQAGFPIYYFPGITVQHCIPPKRTTVDFVRKLGLGVGLSERIRTLSISKGSYLYRLLMEGIKWGGTLAIWCMYLLRGEKAKGDILVIFRKNVTCGLFSKANK